MVEKNIRSIFLEYPEVIYGFTNIAYSEYDSNISVVVVELYLINRYFSTGGLDDV